MRNYLNIINQVGYFYETVKSFDNNEWTFFLKDKKWKILLNKEPILYIEKNEIYEFIEEYGINENSFNHYLYADIIGAGMYYEMYEPEHFTYHMIKKEVGRDFILESIKNMEEGLKEILTKFFKPNLKLIKKGE